MDSPDAERLHSTNWSSSIGGAKRKKQKWSKLPTAAWKIKAVKSGRGPQAQTNTIHKFSSTDMPKSSRRASPAVNYVKFLTVF